MKKHVPKFFDRIKLTWNKDFASNYRGTTLQQDVVDYSTNTLCEQLSVVKKQFENVAYVGSNPETFLRLMPESNKLLFSILDSSISYHQSLDVNPKKLFLCDQSVNNALISYHAVEGIKKKLNKNFDVYPIVLQEDLWPLKPESLDLIVSSMSLHWNNEVQVALLRMLESLIPDGALIGTLLGGHTLEELRISFTLAESERSGGVSEHMSPMISNVDFGNLLARCQYNLPTIYSERITIVFDGALELMQYLQQIGENNALIERRFEVLRGPLYATCSIYDSLFGKEGKIPATFEFINFMGWKYHESQQKPKRRGSAEFSLKDLQKELQDSKKSVTYGEIEVSDESDSEEAKKSKKEPKN